MTSMNSNDEIVIVGMSRTPIGNFQGELSNKTGPDLGGSAIEAAIKTAMDYKGKGHHSVITFKGSFHGINSYGGFLTCRFEPVKNRLKGFPKIMEKPFNNPVIEYKNGKSVVNFEFVSEVLNNIEDRIKLDNNVCAILVEPIQCTYGDFYFPKEFLDNIYKNITFATNDIKNLVELMKLETQ